MLMWVGVGWARGASELTGRTGTLNTEEREDKPINENTSCVESALCNLAWLRHVWVVAVLQGQ